MQGHLSADASLLCMTDSSNVTVPYPASLFVAVSKVGAGYACLQHTSFASALQLSLSFGMWLIAMLL